MNVRKVFVSLLAVGSLVLSACSASESEATDSNASDTPKVGLNFALSGDVSAYGTAMRDGIEMAADEVNADGGVLGEEVELVTYDNKGDDSQAAQLTTRLATEDNVSVVLGSDISSSSKSAVQTGSQVGAPVVAPAATADNVTVAADGSVEPYGYRVGFNDSFQAVALADFATNHLNADRVALLADNSTAYATGLTESFKESYTGDIVAEENYSTSDVDFSAALTNLSTEDFDVLFVPGYYVQVASIIQQAREMGITQPILGTEFATETLVELAGAENMTDVYYTTHFSLISEKPEVQEFITNYEERYGTAPDSFSALGYDSFYVVAEAMERAGTTDPEAVNEELAATTDFEGVTGTFSFDEMHNPIKTVSVVEVQDGEEVDVTEVDVSE